MRDDQTMREEQGPEGDEVDTGPIRVASVPAGHPYVEHLGHPGGGGTVARLPDPAPAVDVVAPGQWWPPRMLDLDWVAEHHDEFDVMHLHFGFDTATPAHLADWVDLLRSHGIPLVLTVHDLVNPHFPDPAGHRAQLDVLIPAATQLITLTERAASIIRDRWGVGATVVPHPHIVPLDVIDTIGGGRPDHPGLVVGIHAKSLRSNIDPTPLLTELTAALPTMPDVTLRVDVHPDVLGQGHPDPRAQALRTWASTAALNPQVQIQVHPRFDDEQLWEYLRAIDLCVLPYRFGTHSGWLEACVDLGTAVLVPATGCYADQHGHPSFGPGVVGLVDMVGAIAARPGLARPARPERREQREQIARTHEQIYQRVLQGRFRSVHHPCARNSEVPFV